MDVRAEDCIEKCNVTVTVSFEISGSVGDLGLMNYEKLDATKPFSARELVKVMVDSGEGSLLKELKDWDMFGADDLVDIEVRISGSNGLDVVTVDDEGNA